MKSAVLSRNNDYILCNSSLNRKKATKKRRKIRGHRAQRQRFSPKVAVSSLTDHCPTVKRCILLYIRMVNKDVSLVDVRWDLYALLSHVFLGFSNQTLVKADDMFVCVEGYIGLFKITTKINSSVNELDSYSFADLMNDLTPAPQLQSRECASWRPLQAKLPIHTLFLCYVSLL